MTVPTAATVPGALLCAEGGQTVAATLDRLLARLTYQSPVPQETLVATMQQVFKHVGVRAFTADDRGSDDGSTWVGVVLTPETIGIAYVTTKDEQDWAENLGPGPDLSRHRANLVARKVRPMRTTKRRSMADLLAMDHHHDIATAVAMQAMVLDAWWHTRLAAGYTPETARFLLSLTAHPTLVTALSFDADNTPTLQPAT